MNVLAISGAGNKRRNTASMLKKAFDGAMSVEGATGELVYLYDLDFKGCYGCHSCKLLDENRLGRCATRDGLTEVLQKAIDADVLLIGSPIYYGNVTGITRAFMERFLFPAMTYNVDRVPLYPKRSKVGWVLTSNAPYEAYAEYAKSLCDLMGRMIGDAEFVMANQTQQFEDYSKYAATRFDEAAVKQRYAEQFPVDLENAFAMGKRLAESV